MNEKSLSLNSVKAFLGRNLVAVAIILLAAYAALVERNFLTIQNLENILRQFGPLSLVALGTTLVLIGGFFDLSCSGIISLVVVVTVSMIPVLGQVGAMFLGLLVGLAAGFIEGAVLVVVGARNGADATFITYGFASLYGALALIWTNGAVLSLPANCSLFKVIGFGQIGFIPVSFVIFMVVMLALAFFLNKTIPGREIRLTGANRVATRLCGVSEAKCTLIVFSLHGLLTAMGSIILFSRVTVGTPIAGTGYELNALLAAVIGGTKLQGGIGNIPNTMVGILLVTVMANALNLIGIPVNMQEVVKGLILIVAIWLDNRKDA